MHTNLNSLLLLLILCRNGPSNNYYASDGLWSLCRRLHDPKKVRESGNFGQATAGVGGESPGLPRAGAAAALRGSTPCAISSQGQYAMALPRRYYLYKTKDFKFHFAIGQQHPGAQLQVGTRPDFHPLTPPAASKVLRFAT